MKLGDVIELGRHRLMCGDAGNPDHVARLFRDQRKPDLVFTSPPYAQQRRYVSGIGDWDTLMQRVFGAMPAHERTQVLVNLGLVHEKFEWVAYWDGWIKWMSTAGWRRAGWYVWNKQGCIPQRSRGRLMPQHEWIFHFNKQPREPNRTVRSKTAGSVGRGGWLSDKGWTVTDGRSYVVADMKVRSSVIAVSAASGNTGHPAVFPVALPTEIIRAYTDSGEVVYEPFAGSGTTILAAEREGRTCCAMEIEPSYCDIAVQRFRKHSAQPPLPGAA